MGIGINNDFSEVLPGLHADIKLQTALNKMRCLPAADHHLKKCHSYRVKLDNIAGGFCCLKLASTKPCLLRAQQTCPHNTNKKEMVHKMPQKKKL